jgi:transposase
MRIDLDNLPVDTVLLHSLVRDMAAVVDHRDGEIERLQLIIKKLQRAQFGRRSERMDDDQLALALEDLDGDVGRIEADRPVVIVESDPAPSKRKPLPDRLPREEILLDVPSDACPCCGGPMHWIGESASEMLDWVPAQLRVIRITRPKYACRTCNKVVQAAAPERPIAGGLATPSLLTQVLISKYCDHAPLYRQAQIYARHGVEIERSTLAGWVGGACWWLEALHDRLCKNVFASDHLFADDTPVPVLDPGRGRTKTGRLWVYAREQRPWVGPELYWLRLDLTDNAWRAIGFWCPTPSGCDHLLLRHRHCIKEGLPWRFAEAPSPLMWPFLIIFSNPKVKIGLQLVD